LLNGLIPVGTLEHRDDIAYRKKLSTSHWATTVVVSLCSKTSELQTPISMRHQDPNEEEYNLTFVRKFVLEHALRAFKEASVSTEPLDQKYSRLLGLSELFNRMLSSKADRATASYAYTSYRHIGKLMFEKGFVGAMTSAIADLDLNFPNSKRAVKYILGPLKQLTDLGIALSQSSDFSSSTTGTTDEEEISSATSVSDDEDDEREQTPDLYRNSTLGMFESSAGHDEDSETDSDDEDDDEMFDDEYGDEMDYEEEPIRDHDEVISDEDDEDIEGMDDIGEIEGVPGDVDIDIDVVMDHHHDDDETVSEDSSDDDDGDDDDEEGDDIDEDFAHEMDEILGNDNASMPGVGEDIDWEEDLGHAGADGGSPHGGPLVPIPQAMASDERSDDGEGNGVVHIDMGDGEEEFFEDELPPEAEDDGKFA
jgi:E3 ubiquitin-protein ligase HUWE1